MMCEGAMTSLLPTMTIRKFGHTRGHDVFAFMYSAYGVSALLGSFLVAQLQYKIGFHGMVMIGLGLVCLAAYLTYTIDEKHIFNYAKLVRTEFETYGETYTNIYGI